MLVFAYLFLFLAVSGLLTWTRVANYRRQYSLVPLAKHKHHRLDRR